MTEIRLELDEKKHGGFNLYEEGSKIGEMVISLATDRITVYHTGIEPVAEGKGYAKLLLEEMVKYSRENNLKVIALCPYVHAQFKRHPDTYADVWLKQE
ncbi:N-acetyltransferase [Flavobacterium album]|uniref:N-acetyltransferase n=1 Tax=Flavobacterium album TaxID=2175091 RepID=A0A2S1QZ71_9FLAO|nr:GNAT family N-acetyltransferase [Flavobacterium album]AWH85672.1 N-acetyltransferase [Flavobacterium album]